MNDKPCREATRSRERELMQRDNASEMSGKTEVQTTEAPLDKPDDKPSEDVKFTGARILVVDDEEVIRMLLTDLLSDDGHEVDSVPCGEDAVVRLKDHPCDIVVTDLMMPGINGVKVLEAVKETDPDIEVLVMTGYSSLETAVECKIGRASCRERG